LASIKTRCTEKAVAEQQAEWVAQWDTVRQSALDFYAQKEAA
jgi:hypothetical protein